MSYQKTNLPQLSHCELFCVKQYEPWTILPGYIPNSNLDSGINIGQGINLAKRINVGPEKFDNENKHDFGWVTMIKKILRNKMCI